jgi:predicted nucleic-acid-binding Zn-ribbon protein
MTEDAQRPTTYPCPKCGGEMVDLETTASLPKLLKPGEPRAVGDPSPAISISDVWAVELRFCQTCRYVELYAG